MPTKGGKTSRLLNRTCRFLADQNVQMIEQPMPAGMKTELAAFKKLFPHRYHGR